MCADMFILVYPCRVVFVPFKFTPTWVSGKGGSTLSPTIVELTGGSWKPTFCFEEASGTHFHDCSREGSRICAMVQRVVSMMTLLVSELRCYPHCEEPI